jgi:Gram-negative bacterial TonB protein C-terminal
MKGKNRAFITMFVISLAIHFLLTAIWSAQRFYTIQNMVEPVPRVFTVVRPSTLPPIAKPAVAQADSTNAPVPVPTKSPPRTKIPNDATAETVMRLKSELAPSDPQPTEQAEIDTTSNLQMGPFQSTIDPKKAWINVAESLNYDLLRGVSMDVSQGEYRLPGEVDLRVRAKGNLTIEYPLIAAALGKEAMVYALLLIDEQGQKIRMQIVRGDPDFDNAVLQSLEKVEFRPAMLKREPVRSLLLLEFEFRRDPPEIGSL